MARIGFLKTKMLSLRETKRCMSKQVGGAERKEKYCRRSMNGDQKREEKSCWFPHPRTGIYVPKGHEGVMDDVPDGAASFGGLTFWLRSVDGVDVRPADSSTTPCT